MNPFRQSVSHESIPRTAQRFAKAHGRGYKDVGLTGLNLLKRADVEVRNLGELLLSDFAGHPLAP